MFQYFYRRTIDSNLVKESLHEKNGHCCTTVAIFIHVVFRMCIQTVFKLQSLSFLNAHIIYRYRKNFVAYLPAFHVNYSDIFSHSLTSFSRKLGRSLSRRTLTFSKKVTRGSKNAVLRDEKIPVECGNILKKPFSPRIIKDYRTRVTMASCGYPCRKGNSTAREDRLLGAGVEGQ